MEMKTWRWVAVISLLFCAPALAQQAGDLSWNTRVERVAGSADQVDLVFSAPISKGWIVYGSDFTPGDFGPRPARLVLQAGGQALSPVASDGAKSGTSRNFAGEYHYTYFADQATFRQRLTLEPGARQVSGVLNGQSCYEESGLCTLFRESFAVALE
jgi:hypothetical protein